MENISQLQKIVQKNCDIVDAKYGQNYGLCIYLLKMRDYYRWHHRIPLHQELQNDDIHKWIADTEEYWEDLSDVSLLDVTLHDKKYTPFQSVKINEHLIPEGFIYSGGLGYGGIPLFFLAELDSNEELFGFNVQIAGKELSRGLYGTPGFFLDDTIYIRKEAFTHLLWSRYDEWNFTKRDNTTGRALSYYSFDKDPSAAIDEITNVELPVLIQHELGEGLLDKEFGLVWPEMVLEFAYSKTEVLLRAVRDLAVDCMTTLPFLIDQQRIPSIHMYFAGFSDMRKELFPSLYDAYLDWQTSSDYGRLSDLVEQGKVYWFDVGKKAIDLFQAGGKQSQNDLDRFIENLSR